MIYQMAQEILQNRQNNDSAKTRDLLDKFQSDPSWFFESKENFLAGGEAFLKIKHRKDDRIRPWVCNNTQHVLLNAFFKCKNERRPVRLVVLKGRQQGVSTCVGAIGFKHMLCYPGANLLIATETKQDSGKNIYNMYRLYKNTFPMKLKTLHEIDGETIEFDESMNYGLINVTGERKVVSFTYKFIHLSEASKFVSLDEFMDDMLETVPMHLLNTSIFVESTAQDYGDEFHDLWQMAEAGSEEGVGWEPLFIPWWIHEEYEYQFRSERHKREFAESLHDADESRYGNEVKLLDLPPMDIPIRKGEIRKVGVTLENLYWRRDKIATMKFSLPRFYRQYPSTADEAFRGAMLSPLDRDSLDWYSVTNVRYEETDEEKGEIAGELRKPYKTGEFFEKDEISNTFEFKDVLHPIVILWDSVYRYREYIIGVDMAQGLESGDFSCAIVISRLPFRVVARLRGLDGRRLDPNEFGRQLFALGQYYNNALICPENNADGGALIRDLVNWNYPNLAREEMITGNPSKRYGWLNNGPTHKRMVAQLQQVIRERSLMIPDEMVIEEMKHIIYRPGRGGGVQAAKKGERRKPGSLPTGYYDDAVFSIGGALLLESVLPAPKDEKTIENEIKITNYRRNVYAREENTYDENQWLNYG